MSARIASRTIKCTKPLNLLEPSTTIDCSQNVVSHKSPLLNQNSKLVATMGSSNIWDDRSIETKIEYFQQNPKHVDIMDKILEKHKECYILALVEVQNFHGTLM